VCTEAEAENPPAQPNTW